MLRAVCLRMLGDPMAADDAAQDASLQALLNLDRLRQPDRFGSWLCGIGLNVCRRYFRDRTSTMWSWETLQGGCELEAPPTVMNDPELRVETLEMADRVHQAVTLLPPGQRSAVLLFYVLGLTYAETAVLLGVEIGAVKTRLHKARHTLRRDLRDQWKEHMMVTESTQESIAVRIADVKRTPGEGDRSAQYVVILEEIDGERRLLIWVGRPEAETMALQLEKTEMPRPLTFGFLADLFGALGNPLREVRISRLADKVFYATALVATPQGTKLIDARPSDALNLALATGAPIRVETAVLDQLDAAPAAADAPHSATKGSPDIVEEIEAEWKKMRPSPAP